MTTTPLSPAELRPLTFGEHKRTLAEVEAAWERAGVVPASVLVDMFAALRELLSAPDASIQSRGELVLAITKALRSDRAANKARIGERSYEEGIEAAAKIADNATVGPWIKGVTPRQQELIDKHADQRAHDIAHAIRSSLTPPVGDPPASLPAIKQESGNG